MKRATSNIFVLLAIMALSGCSTGYQKTGLTGGFSETQIQPDVFEVRFKGNGYTSREKSSDLCLLRCAEITLENNCKFFEILDRQESVKKQTHTNNSYTTSGSFQTYGNTTYGNFNTYGGGSYTVSKPRNFNTIKIHKTKPDNKEVFDASFLANSLRSKYKISN